MPNLHAFSYKDLNSLEILVDEALSEGLRMVEFRDLLRLELKARTENKMGNNPVPASYDFPKDKVVTECGAKGCTSKRIKAVLVENNMAAVFECKKCHWSTLVYK